MKIKLLIYPDIDSFYFFQAWSPPPGEADAGSLQHGVGNICSDGFGWRSRVQGPHGVGRATVQTPNKKHHPEAHEQRLAEDEDHDSGEGSSCSRSPLHCRRVEHSGVQLQLSRSDAALLWPCSKEEGKLPYCVPALPLTANRGKDCRHGEGDCGGVQDLHQAPVGLCESYLMKYITCYAVFFVPSSLVLWTDFKCVIQNHKNGTVTSTTKHFWSFWAKR